MKSASCSHDDLGVKKSHATLAGVVEEPPSLLPISFSLRSGAMFPPVTSATMVPAAVDCFNTAAVAAAPAGSAITCSRAWSHSIATIISCSLTATTSSTSLANHVDVGGQRAADRQAVRDGVARRRLDDVSRRCSADLQVRPVGRPEGLHYSLPRQKIRRRALCDDADDADGGTPVLDRRGDTADQGRVAHRHVDDVDSRQLVDDLQADGAGPGRNIGIAGVVQEEGRFARRVCLRGVDRIADVGARFDEACAEVEDARSLHQVVPGGQEDRRAYTELLRREGNRRAVVARARANDLRDRRDGLQAVPPASFIESA